MLSVVTYVFTGHVAGGVDDGKENSRRLNRLFSSRSIHEWVWELSGHPTNRMRGAPGISSSSKEVSANSDSTLDSTLINEGGIARRVGPNAHQMSSDGSADASPKAYAL
jgi:hypothetical protein